MLNYEDPDLFQLPSANVPSEWVEQPKNDLMSYDESLFFHEDPLDVPNSNPVERQLSLELETEMFFERLHKNYG